MSDFETKIHAAVRTAVKEVYDLEVEDGLYVVETPQNPDFGDYSTNAAMKLSRFLRRNPMDIAAPLAEKLSELLAAETESVTVARPGFINFRLRQDALGALIETLLPAKTMREYGVRPEEIDIFTDSVLESQQRLLKRAPVPMTRELIRSIYVCAYGAEK